jgi:hypothetical protein
LVTEYERQAVIEALEKVMANNIFQSTIYFAAFKEKLQQQFKEIIFYRIYIDDIFIIWQPLTHNNMERRQAFQREINTFGKLKGEFI